MNTFSIIESKTSRFLQCSSFGTQCSLNRTKCHLQLTVKWTDQQMQERISSTVRGFSQVFSLLLIFTLGLCAMTQVADANPFFIFHQVDPDPATIPPVITIFSPQNDQEYYSDRVFISFNVSRPQLGSCHTALIDVKYVLDDETVQAFTIWRNGSASNSWAIPEFDTVFTSNLLTSGDHYLTVTARGVVYSGDMNIFFINGAQTAYFTAGNQSIQLSPIPSQISKQEPAQLPQQPTLTPTLAPTLTPTPAQTQQQTAEPTRPASSFSIRDTVSVSESLLLVIISVGVIGAVLFALVFLRRCNGKKRVNK
jgi:hypothetical protein